MAGRDGEYCFSYLSQFCLIFLHLKSISGQSFGHLVLYDVGNVVILIIVPFLL